MWALVVAALGLVIAWQLHGSTAISWSAPLSYDGDSLYYLITTKRLTEGSGYFINSRQGYPFLSYLFDFPGSDAGSLLALWIGGKLTRSEVLANNGYYLLGFPLTALSAFWALRRFGLSSAVSVPCALLFSMLPFHFFRIWHLYYTWYFVIPLFCWYAVKLFDGGEMIFGKNASLKTRGLHAVALMALACFGVYYSWFGSIALLVSAVLGSIRLRSRRPVFIGLAAVFFVCTGVMANLAPNALLIGKYGKNDQIAKRLPLESEVYGLKIAQMLLPRIGHRSKTLANINKDYSSSFPNVNENSLATLGFVGSIGFLILLYSAIVHSPNADGQIRLLYLFGSISLAMVLIATTGGFSALFAQLVTPQFRGWNRISIFIAFMSLAALAIIMDCGTERKSQRDLLIALFIAIACFGLWDQTTSANLAAIRKMQASYFSDAAFFRGIERSLPKGSAVYQLPYMPFPESPPREGLGSYDMGKGFLHSHHIKWSFGVAAGRDGDDFFASLTRESISTQLEMARFLGFSGIMVDRRGYKDRGAKICEEIAHELGGIAPVEDQGLDMQFYPLTMLRAIESEQDLSPSSIALVRQFGVRRDGNGLWLLAPSDYVVDFTRPLKMQLRSFKGMSAPETWGAWSEGKKVILQFKKALPKRFVMKIAARGFGPNAGAPVRVQVGPYANTLLLGTDMQSFVLPTVLETEQDSIQFTVPSPVSPKERGFNSDERLIGIGFESISITE